jgi:hypothetical protein
MLGIGDKHPKEEEVASVSDVEPLCGLIRTVDAGTER